MTLAAESDLAKRRQEDWESILREALHAELMCIGSIPPTLEHEPMRQLVCESGIHIADELGDLESVMKVCYLALGSHLDQDAKQYFQQCLRIASLSLMNSKLPDPSVEIFGVALEDGTVGYGFADYQEVRKREAVIPSLLWRADSCRRGKPYQRSPKQGRTKNAPRILRFSDQPGSYCLSFGLSPALQGSLNEMEESPREGLVDFILEMTQRIEENDLELEKQFGKDYTSSFRDYMDQLRPDGKKVKSVKLFSNQASSLHVRLGVDRPHSKGGVFEDGADLERFTIHGSLVAPITAKGKISLRTPNGRFALKVERDSLKDIVRTYFEEDVEITYHVSNGHNILDAVTFKTDGSDAA